MSMKHLIRTILREYIDNKEITIKVIGNVKNLKLVKENIFGGDVNLDSETRSEVDSVFNEIKNKLGYLGSVVGSYVDRVSGQKQMYELNINVSYHYVERLFRKEDPKYKNDERVVNPDKYEGIDLILYNKDKLAQAIGTKQVKNNDVVKISTKDGSNYHLLIQVDENKKRSYNITLFNQIKGKGLDFYTFDKEYRWFSPRK